MQMFEHTHGLPAIPPGVIKDDADFVARTIDMALAGGAQAAVFTVNIGSIDADLAVLKVMESETATDATTLGGTPSLVVDALATVVPGANDDNKLVHIIVDLKNRRKRFLQLQAKAGNGAAGTYLSATVHFTQVGVPAANLGGLAVVRG